MEISYWMSRWEKGKTGWHREEVYPRLPEFWPRLRLTGNARVLVPLCGKSHDLDWLAAQGFAVVGVEASKKALTQVMERFSTPFIRTESHGYTVFKSAFMELWQGNFMNFPKAAVPSVDAIYDKASMVALPGSMRKKYRTKILDLCNAHTQILLQSFEYEQQEMVGPPFSLPEQEVKNLFGRHFNIILLHEESKLKEVKKFRQRGLSTYFIEKVYHMVPGETK